MDLAKIGPILIKKMLKDSDITLLSSVIEPSLSMNLRLNGWHSVLVNHILDNRSRFSRIVLVLQFYYIFTTLKKVCVIFKKERHHSFDGSLYE